MDGIKDDDDNNGITENVGFEGSDSKSISSSKSSVSLEGVKVIKKGTVIERRIGLLGAVAIVFGTIIGSGIFISPKGVVRASGSEGLALLIWGIGGIISLFGALSLAELGSVIPKSAGEYNYLRITYAKWLGYLFGWTVGILTKPSSQAVIALTCAEYMLVPVYNDGCGGPPEMHKKMLAVTIIFLLTATNCWSVRFSSNINIVFMVAKLAALVIIVVGGIVRLAQGKLENLSTGFDGSNKKPGQIIMGFYSAMFAYEGWANLTYVTEEIINPKRNIPLTFIISMPLITVLYMLTNVSYFTVMDTEQLLAAPAVAITWAESVIPAAFWVMPMFVAMSTFGTVNGSIFTSGRLFYVMAREDEMPKVLSYVHNNRQTPIPAAVFNSVFAFIYVMAGEVVSLIDFLSFTTWMFIALIQLSVIVLRFTMKDAHRTYKVPIVFPAIVFIFSLALVIIPVVDAPQMEFLYATLIMLAGLVFYIPIVMFDNRAGCMKYITLFFQLLMDVCPGITADEDEVKKEK